MQRSLAKNFTLIAAAALILVAGVAFFAAFRGVKQEVAVMTAAKDLPAYSAVAGKDLKAVPVPKASITDEHLTQKEYKALYLEKDLPLIVTMEVLQNQRLDKRVVAKDPRASFAIVSSDERIVAVTASLQGAAIGTIHAGDVVDIRQDGSTGAGGGVGATFAKVVCIAASASGCQGVLPPGVKLSVKDESKGSDTPRNGNGNVTVLLAVPAADAPNVAGKSVALALNPFCRVGVTDEKQGITPDIFVSTRESDAAACDVSAAAGRVAAGASAQDAADSAAGEDDTTGEDPATQTDPAKPGT